MGEAAIANRRWGVDGRTTWRRRLIGLLVGVGGIKGRDAAKERRREARKVAATGRGVARGGARHGGVVGEGRLGPPSDRWPAKRHTRWVEENGAQPVGD